MAHDAPSFLLSIPPELRLQIYAYLLADSDSITITAAPLTVFGHGIKDTTRKRQIPGLPEDYCPLVRYHYDPMLLSISKPPTIELDNKAQMDTASDKLPFPAPLALLQTCRLINEELGDYRRRKSRARRNDGRLSLYITYPYGVLVLKELYPFLLRQAKNIYISGYYTPQAAVSPPTSPTSPPRQSRNSDNLRPRLRLDPPHNVKPNSVLVPYPECTSKVATATLAKLVRTIFPPVPTLISKLEARIYYPGSGSYGNIWGDDDGPVARLLSNTCGGKIELETYRGRRGNAVKLTVEASPKSRMVSSSWRRLGDSRKESEGFVVSEEWGNDV